jgi:hypothetical protein
MHAPFVSTTYCNRIAHHGHMDVQAMIMTVWTVMCVQLHRQQTGVHGMGVLGLQATNLTLS